MAHTPFICDCGHEESPHESITSGYGKDENGKTFCYACCAERDKAQMIRDGKTSLYLTHEAFYPLHGNYTDGTIQNWPNNLTFPCRVKKGQHNIAGSRYDAWFIGPDGNKWHGVQYGEWTQIIHCKRMKGA